MYSMRNDVDETGKGKLSKVEMIERTLLDSSYAAKDEMLGKLGIEVKVKETYIPVRSIKEKK